MMRLLFGQIIADVSPPKWSGFLTVALLVGLSGCSDVFFYDAATRLPAHISLSYTLPEGATPGLASASSPGEAFDRADGARISIRRGGEVLFDGVVALSASGSDRAAEVEVTLDEKVSLLVELDLLAGNALLFRGSNSVQVTPGVAADVTVPLNAVANGLSILDGDFTISTLGATVQLTAATLFLTGETIEEVSPTWTASASAISISSTGLVTALENGEATVSARFAGFEASIDVVVLDPCSLEATALNFGVTAEGSLNRQEDCLTAAGRLFDPYAIAIPTNSQVFNLTYAPSGYSPLARIFDAMGVQVSGWASTESFFTREHIFPEGLFFVEATSLEFGSNRASAPEGFYSIRTDLVNEPQVGCTVEATVIAGVATSGNITSSDCEDEFDGQPDIVRRWDGFTALLQPGQSLTARVTADFPYRFTYWADNTFVSLKSGAANETLSYSISGGDEAGFHSFFVISGAHEGTGAYEIDFAAGGAAPAPAEPVSGDRPTLFLRGVGGR
jgi:hypothetical protein